MNPRLTPIEMRAIIYALEEVLAGEADDYSESLTKAMRSASEKLKGCREKTP